MSINAWGSDDPAEVAKGGTGAATLTDHGILLGSGTSPVTPTAAPTDGQLLIGNTGGDPSLAAPTGDTNEIAVAAGAGSLGIGIADDCVLPGTGAFTWVDGTTAQEPAGSAGQTRFDTDTSAFRGYDGTSWKDFQMGTITGRVLQVLSSIDGTATTITVTGPPSDDTTPQDSEGQLYLSVTITPQFSTSTMYITGMINTTCDNGDVVAFITNSASADAIGVGRARSNPSPGGSFQTYVMAAQTAGGTSALTYRLYVGKSGGTAYVNAIQTGAARYNGTFTSFLTVMEIAG